MFSCGFAVSTSISKRCGALWLKVGGMMPPECNYCTRVPSECKLTGLPMRPTENMAALSQTGLFQTHPADRLFSQHFPFGDGQCSLFTKHGIGTWNGNIHHRSLATLLAIYLQVIVSTSHWPEVCSPLQRCSWTWVLMAGKASIVKNKDMTKSTWQLVGSLSADKLKVMIAVGLESRGWWQLSTQGDFKKKKKKIKDFTWWR